MNAEEPGFKFMLASPSQRAAAGGPNGGPGRGGLGGDLRLRDGRPSAASSGTVQKGDRIVASNRLYGRTTQLFGQEAAALRP